MKTVVIVQARMTSTRLPGKVIKQILGRPMFEYQLERLLRVRCADELVVACTTNVTDEPIVDLCRRMGVAVFRGAEEDVLSRYHETARIHQADLVTRVSADCPLIDPQVIDTVIEKYGDTAGKYDYVSNTLKRTYPRGMDCEMFSYRVLDEAFISATTRPEREHVTPFIYRQPERYRLANVSLGKDHSHHRWTVDTAEDFELARRIIEALYPAKATFTLDDCLRLLELHPDWAAINTHIEQKAYGQ
ncbi:MAG: glycosyltransferase family protein [bacterium]